MSFFFSSGVRATGGSAIPDSVVSRPAGNSNNAGVVPRNGVQIETKTEWPSIGAVISKYTSGVTRAYLTDNNGNTIQSVDISGLTSGGAFTFDGVNLSANTKYWIVLDAEGSGYTRWFYNSASFPYTSSDVDITAGIYDGNIDTNNVRSVNDVGDTGF